MVVRESASGGFNSVISASCGDNRLNSDTAELSDPYLTPSKGINHK